MGFKKEKKEYEGKPYYSMNKREQVVYRQKVWAEMSPGEQEAKKEWFASPCCRQPYGSRFIGTEGVQQVTCTGCNRAVKKIYPTPEVPDHKVASLGENSPEKDAWQRPKKELERRTDLEDQVPF